MAKKETVRLRSPELLAPAGNWEKLVTAIHYGADAVYCGGKRFGLRAHATNFSEEELAAAVAYAHQHGVKAYVTVNIFAHQADLEGLDGYLENLAAMGVDGVIVADPGVLLRARQLIPQVPIHLSTQANLTNRLSASFWRENGVRRVNLARELSLEEIRAIRQAAGDGLELEVFVHGALCISYSGRCLLSYYLTGRDANQGDCAHPCRYSYRLLEEKRPGFYFPVEEDERGTYIFNAKDLCLLERLPELVACSVDSLKIEGRMKGIYYVGGTVRVYRAALDYLAEAARAGANPAGLELPARFREELDTVGTRGSSENFFCRPPDGGDMLYDAPRASQPFIPAGVVKEPATKATDRLETEVRNTLRAGDRLEYLDRGLATVPFTVKEIVSKDGEERQQANPGDRVTIVADAPFAWEENALLRKKT